MAILCVRARVCASVYTCALLLGQEHFHLPSLIHIQIIRCMNTLYQIAHERTLILSQYYQILAENVCNINFINYKCMTFITLGICIQPDYIPIITTVGNLNVHVAQGSRFKLVLQKIKVITP